MYELYILDTCPYSIKVMNYFDENKIPYIKKNINENDNYAELLTFGRKEQVPFLYDPDKNIKMYESDEIIEFVSKNK